MDPFINFQNVIANALQNSSTLRKSVNEQFDNFNGRQKLFSLKDFELQKSALTISQDLIKIASEMGATPFREQQVGHHPHFKHLKHTNNSENHNIVSVFVDVKGSSNLFRNYDNETVFIITNTIQLAAISVCTLFGGFIQRLEGDGLFVYFGGKGIEQSLANIHCLTALSFFTYFVENDLKKLFEQNGIERIKAKVGIDFGYDRDVLWAMAGVNDSSEITTISLHTSLASKMQKYAGSNEIIIGQNVVTVSKIDPSLLDIIPDKRYIYQVPEKGFNYTQYKFNWIRYLKSLKYIATDTYGKMIIKSQNQEKLHHIGKDSSSLQEIASINKPWQC